MKSFSKVLILTLAVSSFCVSFAKPVDLLTVGSGSWLYVPRPFVHYATDYYSKISVHAYGSTPSFTYYALLPLMWSYANNDTAPGSSGDKQQIMVGDFSGYIAKRFGTVEPRIGIKFPLGYSTDFAQKAWIGPGNIRLWAGVGLNSETIQTSDVLFSAELMGALYLGSWNAAVDVGSWNLAPIVKVSWRPSQAFKVGAELLGSFARSGWGGTIETSFSAVPNIFGELSLTNRTALNIKAGIGPLYKDDPWNNTGIAYSGTNINLSASVNIYP
jgi:hypothetical protein